MSSTYRIENHKISIYQEDDEFKDLVILVDEKEVGVLYYDARTGYISLAITSNRTGDQPVNIELGERIVVEMAPAMVQDTSTHIQKFKEEYADE